MLAPPKTTFHSKKQTSIDSSFFYKCQNHIKFPPKSFFEYNLWRAFAKVLTGRLKRLKRPNQKVLTNSNLKLTQFWRKMWNNKSSWTLKHLISRLQINLWGEISMSVIDVDLIQSNSFCWYQTSMFNFGICGICFEQLPSPCSGAEFVSPNRLCHRFSIIR